MSALATSAPALTAERLREVLRYDPETGVFTRLVRTSHNAPAGSVAGGFDSLGYVVLSVLGRRVRGHRLAWLYMTGEWPKGEVDHRDGNRANNRWKNLRDGTKSENMQNMRRATAQNKTTGLLGAHRHSCGRFTAQIRLPDGTRRHLGLFDTAEEAHEAYLAAKRQHHKGGTL